MKKHNKKHSTTFIISYYLTKRVIHNGVKRIYRYEIFCCGSGYVSIAEYHGLFKNGIATASYLKYRYIKGGYKLAHEIYNSCNNNKFSDIDIHTNVI